MSDWSAVEGRFDAAFPRTTAGEVISYTPDGGSEITTDPAGDPLRGVFSEFLDEANLDGGPAIRSAIPNVGIYVPDLGGHSPAQGDTVQVRGTDYLVATFDPPAESEWIVLRLQRPT